MEIKSKMAEIFNLLAVLLTITVTIVLPPLLPVLWMSSGKHWPKLVFDALVLGLSSQSVIGLLWDHLVAQAPCLEVLLYYLFWLVVFLVVMVSHKRNISLKIDRKAIAEGFLIFGLLLAAVIVRSIHPLQHFALCQSHANTPL